MREVLLRAHEADARRRATMPAAALLDGGGIAPLVQALAGGKLSDLARRDCQTLLAALAPMGGDVQLAIERAGGVGPLTRLLSHEQPEARELPLGNLLE